MGQQCPSIFPLSVFYIPGKAMVFIIAGSMSCPKNIDKLWLCQVYCHSPPLLVNLGVGFYGVITPPFNL